MRWAATPHHRVQSVPGDHPAERAGSPFPVLHWTCCWLNPTRSQRADPFSRERTGWRRTESKTWRREPAQALWSFNTRWFCLSGTLRGQLDLIWPLTCQTWTFWAVRNGYRATFPTRSAPILSLYRIFPGPNIMLLGEPWRSRHVIWFSSLEENT